MAPIFPLTQDLVLIGGGHTHALVLRMWGMQPLPGVRVTVINPGPSAPYSGMLPGFVAGHYGREDLDIDLVRLARFAGARIVVGAATTIDPVARTVSVPGRPPISYDVASIDIGITSEMPVLPGFARHGIPAKPLGVFAARWDAYRGHSRDPKIAIIGGGVAGAELAMAMAHAMQTRGTRPEVSLIDRGRVLDDFNLTARRKLLGALQRLGVTLVEQATVTEVAADHVRLADGRMIASEFTCGAAGAKPHDWLGQTGLVLHDGFIGVNAQLQSSDPAVFAVGDCAHMTDSPRPKAGVYAVRQAPVLFDNLRAAVSGGALRPYRPQKDYLKLISLGGKVALAEKLGTAFAGPLLWRWKNRIDQTFMDKFRHLPPMAGPDLPLTVASGLAEALGDKPMCGGCGAKVGRGALRGVLAALPVLTRPDVQSVPGDDAAILLTGGVRQVLTTDHLAAMMADPVVMTRIAAVHALGDVWAMGATPQAATISLILPRQSTALQRRMLAEIMAVATDVMTDAGAAIVGGHTTMGQDVTIGFSVTGLCEGAPVTLAGAQDGDALILTKPIGSGVLMAAEMVGRAQGADIQAAWALMAQGQGVASALLRGAAHAMTDVTGFGLAGHLGGLCEASGVRAEVQMSRVPLMAGALALAEAGMRSTIFEANRADAGPVFGAAGARGDLLFDPQTAGGLLAAVPQSQAQALCDGLVGAGYPAAIIGRIIAGDPGITVLP